jgi:hypothetical protein
VVTVADRLVRVVDVRSDPLPLRPGPAETGPSTGRS